MRALIILGGVAAAGWWAYDAGYLDGVMPPAQAEPDPAPKAAPAITEEEALLQDNIDIVSPWARDNMQWTAAIMWAESRGNTSAVSPKGALGLMQVMPATAQDIYRWGWDDFSATPATLLSERGSIYFGTAYLEYLSRMKNDREWITRAYNAGPGGKTASGWPRETEDYLAAVKNRFSKIRQLWGA